jgi:Xaa-Pro aminopeptidase
MPDVLLVGDTVRMPELRHEVPLLVPDAFTLVEHDGVRHVFVSSMEADRIRQLGLGLEVHVSEEIGIDELVAAGLGQRELELELVVRACRLVGLREARVPSRFPAGPLDRVRADGVDLVVDQEHFDERRRVKTKAQLAGLRRAQKAADAAMATVAALLAQAENGDGVLWLDGGPLTVERIKADVSGVFVSYRCTAAEDFVVAPGAQGAVGHEMGHGPIRVGETIVVDVWPRDDESGCFADMTRTFVVGEPGDEVREWHRLVREALTVTTAMVRPGADCHALFAASCDVFEAAGQPTQRTKEDGVTLRDGFFHALGHGVGLEVHEQPLLGRLHSGALVAGDVITLEPGLYRAGVGGVRLEDLVLVTDDGCEVLGDFPYDLEVRAG